MTEDRSPNPNDGVSPPANSAVVRESTRTTSAVLAWVGIVAGVVFIVAVVFFSGFFIGRHSTGDFPRWHHRDGAVNPGMMQPGMMQPGMMGPGMMPHGPMGPMGPGMTGPGMMGPQGPAAPGQPSPTTTAPRP